MEAGPFSKALFSFDKNNKNLSAGIAIDTNTEEGSYLIFSTFCAVENADTKKIDTRPQILFQ